jgi:uncharacterized protein YndB with AHSA1/START domain
MLNIIPVVLVALVVALVVFVSRKPKAFRITRSATLSAPVALVFAQVNDLHAWQEWSPWAKRDPAAKNTFAGPSAGVGAVFGWAGNREVGAGRMTIIESRVPERVCFKLEFLKPFAATHTAEFTFAPAADGATTVTWSMSGENNFFSRALCMFVDLDKVVGRDFELGLENLRALTVAKT